MTLKSPIVRTNESTLSNINLLGQKEEGASIQDMLQKYQEKYKKQKEDMLSDLKKEETARQEQHPQKSAKVFAYEFQSAGGESGILETESDEGGYVNRSFVVGGKHGTAAGPFEFISSSAYPTEQTQGRKDAETEALVLRIKELDEELKIAENQRLKAEKQVLQMQIAFDSQAQQRE